MYNWHQAPARAQLALSGFMDGGSVSANDIILIGDPEPTGQLRARPSEQGLWGGSGIPVCGESALFPDVLQGSCVPLCNYSETMRC